MADLPMLAGCVIFNVHGAILLMHRKTPGRTQWETPGGIIDPGEEPHQTASRELEEELGIKVKIGRELGHRDFEEDGKTMHYIWFHATIAEGEPSIMEPDLYDDIRDFTWEEMEMRQDELSPNAKNLLDAYQKREIVVRFKPR
jgi:8-oxo-dGTP diphosphatase